VDRLEELEHRERRRRALRVGDPHVTAPVLDRPSPAQLRRLVTGQLVSAAHGRHWAAELGYLLAYNLPPVCSVDLPEQLAGYVAVVARVGYVRTPGCDVVRVLIGLRERPPGATMRVNVAAAGAVALEPTRLDGSATLTCPPQLLQSYETHEALFDVTALTPGTPVDFVVTATDVNDSRGICELHVIEVPQAATDPVAAPSTEVGVDAAWPHYANPLVDGAIPGPRGTRRLVAQLDRARTEVRPHFQLVTYEDDTNAWFVQGTTFASPFATVVGVADVPRFGGRAWRLKTGLPAKATLRCRYKTTGGSAATLRVRLNGVNTDIALPNSATFTALTAAITLPNGGTNQEFTAEFEAKSAGAVDRVRISQLLIYGTET
jgi:hypothetical protein